MLRRIFSCFILVSFILTSLPGPYAYGQVAALPQPGVMVGLSEAFTPVILKGMTVHPDQPLVFDFIVDNGQSGLKDQALSNETVKLAKYFLAGIAIPEKDLWVNLSPYEKGRIIEANLSHTEMGRDMLAQDYILKQLASSLTYPESALGKEFWDKVYAQAQATFGTTDIPTDIFNKVWIAPEKATVYRHGNNILISEAKLKVMLETDYLATANNASPTGGHVTPPADQDVRGSVSPSRLPGSQPRNVQATQVSTSTLTPNENDITNNILREVIIPALETEVNEGKNFAPLRQVFYSMILANWYKRALKTSLLAQAYADSRKTAGIAIALPEEQVAKIYANYVAAFKAGVFNYVKEDVDRTTGDVIPRKYFSGGENFSFDTAESTTPPSDDAKGNLTVQRFRLDQVAAAGNTYDQKILRDIGRMPQGQDLLSSLYSMAWEEISFYQLPDSLQGIFKNRLSSWFNPDGLLEADTLQWLRGALVKSGQGVGIVDVAILPTRLDFLDYLRGLQSEKRTPRETRRDKMFLNALRIAVQTGRSLPKAVRQRLSLEMPGALDGLKAAPLLASVIESYVTDQGVILPAVREYLPPVKNRPIFPSDPDYGVDVFKRPPGLKGENAASKKRVRDASNYAQVTASAAQSTFMLKQRYKSRVLRGLYGLSYPISCRMARVVLDNRHDIFSNEASTAAEILKKFLSGEKGRGPQYKSQAAALAVINPDLFPDSLMLAIETLLLRKDEKFLDEKDRIEGVFRVSAQREQLSKVIFEAEPDFLKLLDGNVEQAWKRVHEAVGSSNFEIKLSAARLILKYAPSDEPLRQKALDVLQPITGRASRLSVTGDARVVLDSADVIAMNWQSFNISQRLTVTQWLWRMVNPVFEAKTQHYSRDEYFFHVKLVSKALRLIYTVPELFIEPAADPGARSAQGQFLVSAAQKVLFPPYLLDLFLPCLLADSREVRVRAAKVILDHPESFLEVDHQSAIDVIREILGKRNFLGLEINHLAADVALSHPDLFPGVQQKARELLVDQFLTQFFADRYRIEGVFRTYGNPARVSPALAQDKTFDGRLARRNGYDRMVVVTGLSSENIDIALEAARLVLFYKRHEKDSAVAGNLELQLDSEIWARAIINRKVNELWPLQNIVNKAERSPEITKVALNQLLGIADVVVKEWNQLDISKVMTVNEWLHQVVASMTKFEDPMIRAKAIGLMVAYPLYFFDVLISSDVPVETKERLDRVWASLQSTPKRVISNAAFLAPDNVTAMANVPLDTEVPSGKIGVDWGGGLAGSLQRMLVLDKGTFMALIAMKLRSDEELIGLVNDFLDAYDPLTRNAHSGTLNAAENTVSALMPKFVEGLRSSSYAVKIQTAKAILNNHAFFPSRDVETSVGVIWQALMTTDIEDLELKFIAADVAVSNKNLFFNEKNTVSRARDFLVTAKFGRELVFTSNSLESDRRRFEGALRVVTDKRKIADMIRNGVATEAELKALGQNLQRSIHDALQPHGSSPRLLVRAARMRVLYPENQYKNGSFQEVERRADEQWARKLLDAFASGVLANGIKDSEFDFTLEVADAVLAVWNQLELSKTVKVGDWLGKILEKTDNFADPLAASRVAGLAYAFPQYFGVEDELAKASALAYDGLWVEAERHFILYEDNLWRVRWLKSLMEKMDEDKKTFLRRDIEDVDEFSDSVKKSFIDHGILTVGALVTFTEDELSRHFLGVGRLTLQKIKDFLKRGGCSLRRNNSSNAQNVVEGGIDLGNGDYLQVIDRDPAGIPVFDPARISQFKQDLRGFTPIPVGLPQPVSLSTLLN
ncbi:MAG: hypothetical protein HQL22_00450 [Candidatus Omnitrophica bacterium]|nr:hypothetical protein [Candidatus Omnitrophota bacterium]